MVKILSLKKEYVKSVEEVFDEFIYYCEIKNLSINTILYYKDKLEMFSKYYNFNKPINIINKRDVYGYIYFLQNTRKVKTTTINTYLRALRTFLYYAMDNGYLNKFKIEMIKTDLKIKKTYSNKELKKLLRKPNKKGNTFAQYRNWVIVNFLIGTGCRSRTLLNIKIKDLDLENGYVLFRITKSRKQQLLPISRSLNKIILDYLSIRRGEEEDYLFCTNEGDKLSREGLKSAIKRYNHSRDVEKTSIHLFRHTFAKKWILNYGDPYKLQKILGHSNMDMVKNYLNMYTEDIKKDFELYNPLEEFVSE